ncbi:UNVERIFIED_CONTAM: hypothetical protein PYX00_004918 [Menopon gallinae]|uniref:Peptidase M12B domain-containing protein n=1 Tax=Menopon gallinae TaxID=328185 RepID=A0AAW2I7Q5_9NEOP
MAVFKLYKMVTLTAVLQHFSHTLAVENKKIHQHMSPDELRKVFHVDRHELVPEYEVVMVHAATPYMSYQEDNIGPPSPDAAKDGKAAVADIWSVLSELSRKKDDIEKTRRGPDNVEDIEEVHDRVMKFSAFGKDLELKLKKTSGLFGKGIRMWETLSNSSNVHGIEYRELPQEKEEDIGELYQDEKNQAALLVHSDKDGRLLVEGTIGHDLVVKPVPSSVRHLVTPPDDELFLDANDEDIQNDVTMDTGKKIKDAEKRRRKRRRRRDAGEEYHHHIIYKRAGVSAEDYYSDYAFMEPDSLKKRHRTRRGISKREAPYVIFPEILVIVDYDGYRLHGGDNVQIKRYFVSFWNGVDLRYKLLKGPKIRISIAGIIISRGRDATPYLERNRVGRDAIDSAAALTDMGKYLFRERRLPVYDIAVAVTKLDMCRRQFANDACNRGTAGFAYVGGACVVNKRLEKVNSVAIIEDTGGFSGIIVAAHEVGHLLGAVHDGSPPPSYLGGPGAEKCRWEDGFIMSDLRHTEKGFKWSSCSIASFHHFLNGDTATCLFNSPHEDESLPRVLPGKLLSLDAQCRKDRGTSACFKDDRVCSQLFCFDAGSGYCVAYRPAAEGSPCGDGQYCISGRCVAEHENIIPDYSQNAQSYLRRDDSENLATQPRPIYAYPNSTTQRYEVLLLLNRLLAFQNSRRRRE